MLRWSGQLLPFSPRSSFLSPPFPVFNSPRQMHGIMDSNFIPTLERKYGRNALPNLFDAKAKDPSSRPYARVMRSPNPDDGFDAVTYSTVANAVNRASWWLVNEVGLAEGEVFAYLGPSDLRYVFLFVAAAKTGRKVSQHLPFRGMESNRSCRSCCRR